MKQQQVSVKFSTPRYRALCYYLEKEASPPQRSTRKKPNADRNAVSGEETDGGATTRPSEEKPV